MLERLECGIRWVEVGWRSLAWLWAFDAPGGGIGSNGLFLLPGRNSARILVINAEYERVKATGPRRRGRFVKALFVLGAKRKRLIDARWIVRYTRQVGKRGLDQCWLLAESSQ